ncbi:MAG: peptidase, partial [Chloroflexota bacterium]
MPERRKPDNTTVRDRAEERFQEGLWRVEGHPLFAPLAWRASIRAVDDLPRMARAVVSSQGGVRINVRQPASASEWAWVIAHCLLHLGMGHFEAEPPRHKLAWNTACDLAVARFLADFRFGRSPQAPRRPDIGAGQTEETLFERFVRDGVPDHLKDFGTTPFGQPDMLWEAPVKPQFSFVGYQEPEWQELFGEGLKLAVSMAVNVVGGEAESMTVYGRQDTERSAAQRAKAWFVNSYPLLGSLAVAFDIIESAKTCQAKDISVAAVSVETQEIYFNPAAGLSEEELRFVMAHE